MAVTLSLFAGAGAQFFDNTGNVLSGGKIYTYQAGTSTPLAVYTSNSESAFHTNPIILDAAGRVPSGGEIWLQLGIGYKFVLKTSTDVLIATYDNIPSSAQPPSADDADSIMYEQGYTVTAGNFSVGKIYRIASVGTTDFTLIGATANTVGTHFIATGVGTGTGTAELSQTVETKLRETVSVKDFGAVGDGVTDDAAAIQAALSSGAGRIYFPDGTYLVSQGFDLDAQFVFGSDRSTSVLKPSSDIQHIFKLGGIGAIEDIGFDLDSRPTIAILLTSFTGSGGQFRSGTVENVKITNAGSLTPTNISGVSVGSTTTVTTSSPHNLNNGDFVFIQDVVGCVSAINPSRSIANNYFNVYDVTSTTFKLAYDCPSYSPVISTGYSAYVSGGTVTRIGAAIVGRKVEEFPQSQPAPHSVSNVICENNYAHIVTFFSYYGTFDSVLLRGATTGHSIAQIYNTRAVKFRNCTISTGVWIDTGVRETVFDGCVFQTNTDWLDPVIDAIGHNNSRGNAGGEIANCTLINCLFEQSSASFVGPYILTNGHSWAFKNCVTKIRQATNWTWANFASTQYLELTQLTFESTQPWFLTDATNGTGIHTRANGLWFTQGVVGTAYWGRNRYGSLLSDNSFITVEQSNLNHAIASTGNGGDRYIFEQIEGDLDLTNAKDGTSYAFAVSGTITAPEKLGFVPSDYNVSTFTPNITFGTNVTFNSRSGTSVKVGKTVTVYMEFDISNSDPDVSAVGIGGWTWPISSTNSGLAMSFDPNASTFFQISTNGVPLAGYLSSFTAELYKSDGTDYTFNNCNSSGIIKCVMTYLTN